MFPKVLTFSYRVGKAGTLGLGVNNRTAGFPPARPEIGWKLTDADLRSPRFLNVGGIVPADALIAVDERVPVPGSHVATGGDGPYGVGSSVWMGRLWADDAWFTLSASDRTGIEGQIWDGELLMLRARQRASVFHAALSLSQIA
jgi:hypothetical protein